MIIRIMLALGVFALGTHGPATWAAPISLDAVDSGQIRYRDTSGCIQGGTDSAQHSDSLTSVGFSLSPCGFGTSTITRTSGYWIFDLSTVAAPASSASVSVSIDSLSGVSGALDLYDYTQTSAAALSNLAVGAVPVGVANAFENDVSSGNLLASLAVNNATSSGVYDLTLSPYALGLIDNTNGLLALGVSYSPDFSGALFAERIDFAGPAQLNLDLPDGSVPLPATWSLLAVSLAGLGFVRRRRA
ncbi:MAG: PEP-CTERM sorting domain-containing protein [Pseudomonadota bacterium]